MEGRRCRWRRLSWRWSRGQVAVRGRGSWWWSGGGGGRGWKVGGGGGGKKAPVFEPLFPTSKVE